MKRKNSSVQSCVYKYALLPPTSRAEEVEQSFEGARRHYNALVQVEHLRRYRYRSARRRLFPEYELLEAKVLEKRAELAKIRKSIRAAKSAGRTRAVASQMAATARTAREALLASVKQLKNMRIEISGGPGMKAVVEEARAEANASVKLLRPTLYWGTYLLNEAAMQSASRSLTDPAYRDDPPHRLTNRIGVHFCGGASVDDLASSTLMQISPMPIFRVRPSGKIYARGRAARTTLRFRVGSDGPKKDPVFADFPMVMDRPLPDGCRIKDAYVKRSPLSVRQPWRYELCVVIDHPTYSRSVLRPGGAGRMALNFGWREMFDGDLRVCVAQTEAGDVREIMIPRAVVNGFAKCDELRGIMDGDFDVAKLRLSTWLREREDGVPEAFREAFSGVAFWRSKHELAELVGYWRGRRVDGDDEIFAAMDEWLDRYRHLGDWERHQSRHLLDWRRNFFRVEAARLVRENTCVVMDATDIAKLARSPDPEVEREHGDKARRNRMIAAPGELRAAIVQAAKKYGCSVDAVSHKDNTRRCNQCGEVCTWDQAAELDHTCSCGATWDQDLNNTDNVLERHASGEAVSMVRPANVAGGRSSDEEKSATFGAARAHLANSGRS